MTSSQRSGTVDVRLTYRKFIFALCLAILWAATFHSKALAAAAPDGGGAKIFRPQSAIHPNKLALPGVVVVKFKPNVVPSMQKLYNVPELQKRIVNEANPTAMNSVLSLLKVKIDKASEVLNNIYLVHYSGTVTPAMMAQSLEQNPYVEFAEPHYMYKVNSTESIPSDSLISTQYALKVIQAFQAWNITMGSPTVSVGIVDTGVNWMHPDLYPNIWHNPHWRTDTQYPADSIGWDFGGNGNNGNPTPDNNPQEDFPPPYEHGTHVAGIVAAAGVDSGTVGVAPGCKIMCVKASEKDLVDPNTGFPYIVFGFEGIIYAADNGARVINCSWGGVGYSQYEQDVIDYAAAKGALVVAAAGNDNSEEFQTPAYYQGVLSVAATDQNDVKTYFTNYSYNVSVSAPGLDIISTYGTDSYATLNGTSMASPCAAGVAALVASEYPNYTAQQIMEQVRVSSDNIYNINPTFADMLGFGRVDAYRALTVSSPGVQISGITLSDSAGGNNDGIFTDGETIQVFGTATDWLSPTSNLKLTLASNDPNVTIVNSTEDVGALETLGTFNMRSNPLSFKVNPGTPDDYVATFVIQITDGSYSDYASFSAILNPIYNQVEINNCETTISAKGNIGFNDYPDNTQGIGFIYKPDEDSLLFEGAFMAGISPTQVVDCARGKDQSIEDNDFRPVTLVTVKTPGRVADQESIATFTDSNATVANRIGIEVTLHTYAWNRDSTSNFMILKYDIRNLNATPITNFYAGLFFDWDIGPGGANNIAAYDKDYALGYAYNVTRSPRTYTGIALLDGGQINYDAISNPDSANGIYNGFTRAHKWEALSGGTGNSYAGPTDISMVVSGGPVSIQPDTSATLVFAVVAGDTLSDLEHAVDVAREMSDVVSGIYSQPPIPRLAELYQNFPNPFNPTTTISFALNQDARIKVEVFNDIGQKVRTIVDQSYPAGGPYYATMSSIGLASGVYFVRLRATSASRTYIQTEKAMVIK